MARLPRIVLPGYPHHITQRGNYKQQIYFRSSDYQLYLDLLKEYSRHYGASNLAYCLMPNHVHLVAVPHKEDSFARLFRRIHGEYARAVHTRLRRVGHLFQARYYSAPMDEKHFWHTMLYVEENPRRAALVTACEDWKWSSARAHLAGTDGGFLDLIPWREQHTPTSWKLLLEKGLAEAAIIERIREASNSGRPLGDEEFVKRVQELSRRSSGSQATTIAESNAYSQSATSM
ncbi:MAG: transposase [Acidobacteria bacterium]|nr:transposase [Acidobacteriota bacterium]